MLFGFARASTTCRRLFGRIFRLLWGYWLDSLKGHRLRVRDNAPTLDAERNAIGQVLWPSPGRYVARQDVGHLIAHDREGNTQSMSAAPRNITKAIG